MEFDSFTDFIEVPLEKAGELITSNTPCIDTSKSTAFFIFGYEGRPTGTAVSIIIPGLLGLGTKNVILVNWKVEAGGGLLGPLAGYPLHAVPECKKVGGELGDTLLNFIKLGVKLESIHLIGHSLGAQVAGYAGRQTQKQGVTLPRITALDPARLGFEPPVLAKPVDASCAAFVDVVHCDPGGYAMNSSTGDVDIWTNYGEFINGTKLQPGCSPIGSPLDIFTNGNICNHNRCVKYYTTSLTMTDIFEAAKADEYYAWLKDDGQVTDTTFIGPLVDEKAKGVFHLSQTAKFRCYDRSLRSINSFTEVEVSNCDSLITSCLDVNKNTTLIVGGYRSKPSGPMYTTLIPTLLAIKDDNIIMINWEKEASENGLGFAAGFLIHALPNSKIVGVSVGKALARLVSLGLKAFIHLIGHSLGAHIAGFAGDEAKKNGLTIINITALDPARGGFQPPLGLKPVGPSAAISVTIAHCDPGGYALNISLGHRDIWFNRMLFVNGNKLQPGCARGEEPEEEFYTQGVRCNHDRCYKYYNASLTNPTAFKAGKATTIYEWEQKNGVFEETTYFGPLIDMGARDDYFLNTGSEYIWGLGDAGLQPS